MIPTHRLSYLTVERSQTTRNLLTQVLYSNWSSLLKQEHFISGIVLMNVELCRRKVINKPFISYIINTHFLHGNIWTQNWPAPNVSGVVAQLVEHRTGIARSWVWTPLKSWIFFSGFFTQLHKLHSLQWSFLHFHFISPVHIWFISYIINKPLLLLLLLLLLLNLKSYEESETWIWITLL